MKVRAILILFSMFLLLGATPAADTTPQPQQTSGWTYQGCFSLNGSQPCYDVYTHNGGYWMCAACRTTGKPSENKCRLLSAYQLANGRWCS
jgi:hypothetical protein